MLVGAYVAEPVFVVTVLGQALSHAPDVDQGLVRINTRSAQAMPELSRCLRLCLSAGRYYVSLSFLPLDASTSNLPLARG